MEVPILTQSFGSDGAVRVTQAALTMDGHPLPDTLVLRFTGAADLPAVARLFDPAVKNLIDPPRPETGKGYVVKRQPDVHQRQITDGNAVIVTDPDTGTVYGITMAYPIRSNDLTDILRQNPRYLNNNINAVEVGTCLSSIPGLGSLMIAALSLQQKDRHPNALIVTEILKENGTSHHTFTKYYDLMERGALTIALHHACNSGTIAPEDQGNDTEWYRLGLEGVHKAREKLRTVGSEGSIRVRGADPVIEIPIDTKSAVDRINNGWVYRPANDGPS